MGVGMMVHAGAEIDESVWPLDQRCQNIGRQRIDREYMGQAICRQVVSLTVADRSIMDHGIEAAQIIDARSDLLCTRDGVEVTFHDGFGSGHRALGVIGAGSVTSVQDDLMALVDQQLPCH